MAKLFQNTHSANIKIVLFIFISIAAMFLDHRLGYLDTIRSSLSTLIYPVQYVVNLPVKIVTFANEFVLTHGTLKKENERLKEEQLLLNSKLQRYAVLEAENNRLRELFESSLRLSERVLIAELMAVDLQPFKHQIRIDKGQNQGAYDGQPILDANGIMGQIVYVSPFYSDVLLITDPTHSIPVQINRNGLRAIAVGTGQKDLLLLEHLPTNADISVGDLIVSSGLGRRFPSGYPVGVVDSISLEPGESFAKVIVKPSARLESSREVLLVWPQEQFSQNNNDENELAYRHDED